MSSMSKGDGVAEPIKSAPKDVLAIIKRVLLLEKEKLYLNRPRVKDDIIQIIKEEIREAD